YGVTDSAQRGNIPEFVRLRDHTGNANGRMLLVNADAANTRLYAGSFFGSLCAGQQYSLSFYAAFVGNGEYKTLCDAFGGFQYPRIKMRIRDGVSGLIITETSTAIISDTTWRQYGLKFITPVSFGNIIFELINDAPGGCGNDIAIDDIQFGGCDPLPSVTADVSDGCIGLTTVITSALSDPGVLPAVQYQWAVGNAVGGPFTAIPGATSANLTISPVTGSDVGKYYILYVAAPGNMGNSLCRYASTPVLLVSKDSSRPASSAARDKNNICPGKQVALSLTGGQLGTNASWRWYAGSCSGTLVGTGTNINVTPASTTTYYVRAEGDCNNTVCRTVTVTVSCDIDKDDDGIPDYVESYIPAATQDANGNGVDNSNDVTYAGYVDNNNDFLNDNFVADGDLDNDGTPNYLDSSFPGRIDTNGDGVDDRFDMDLDRIPNMLDLDSDNDGIPDVVEAGGVDDNGDGKIDNYSDTDADGFSQNSDGNNTGAYISGIGLGLPDLDNDGVPNTIDRDSDNDGIPDVVEVYGTDVNNDGIIDGFVDANSDGLHDAYIYGSGLLRTGPDIDNNGRADYYPNKNMDNDGRANPYDIDSDGDGIVDVVEAGFADTDFNGFVDGARGTDGWSIIVNGLPALNLVNTDAATDAGGAKPNWRDVDSDNDGIPDNVEGMSTAGYRLPAFADADNDGLDNSYDLAPFAGTFGGSGNIPYDRDIDGIPDFRDLDTDADGALDIYEGHDYNFNGVADDNIIPLNADTDNDGLDNFFDLINGTSLNYKGTSAYMGNGGTLTGDASPGSRATVQKRVPAQPDRDWRYTFYVLPIQLVKFTAVLNNEMVNLNWSIISSKELQGFEIERSFDNRTFTKIKTVSATGLVLNQERSFAATDDIINIYKDVIFYRLKLLTKTGEVQYSDVQMIRRTKIATGISVHPNPANDFVNIQFSAEKETTGTFRLIDNLGKVVLLQNQRVVKGANKILLDGLSRFSPGAYTLQIQFSDRIETFKLLVNSKH
ncbi:MAG: T9SS type A sorting domain-containing protein, partial [Ferruginibacter sp.]